jgi:hypothetical protein
MGEWSTCNATCGYGVRTRTMTCVSVQGFIGALSDCKLTTEGGCVNRGGVHQACFVPSVYAADVHITLNSVHLQLLWHCKLGSQQHTDYASHFLPLC